MATTLVIGDLHYGEHADSPKHNKQISDFLAHVCEKHADVDRVIQMGDWFHNRSKIQSSTLNRAIEGAEMLNRTFGKDRSFVLTGNHDIPFRDSLDDSSLTAISHLVTVVDKPMTLGNFYLSPWIVSQDEWENVVDQGKHHDFLFAHLELNSFLMNDHHRMENGHSPKELRDYYMVITGHYHSQQRRDNIQYVGTPIPMSQNETNRDMGYWLLDGDDLQFHVYDKVKMISVPYSDLDDVLKTLDDPENTSIRVEFPDEIEDESVLGDVAERLIELNFSNVKVKYTGNTAKRISEAEVDDITEIDNIDAKVREYLSGSLDVPGVEKDRLNRLYDKAAEGTPSD